MKIHLQVAAAAIAAALAAGCGTHAGSPAGAKGSAALTAKTTINKPVAGGPKAEAEDAPAIESVWSGTVGGRPASISLGGASFVSATIGRNRFDGSNFGSSCTGTLRRGNGTAESVNMSSFSQTVTGRVGRDQAMATVSPSGWVTGRVGSVQIRLSVNNGMITGDFSGVNVFLGGSGVVPGEGLGMTAALIVLAACTD